MAKPLTY